MTDAEDNLRKALSDACDVAIWMSGSPTFGPEGEGFDAWTETMRPKLFAALDILKDAGAECPNLTPFGSETERRRR